MTSLTRLCPIVDSAKEQHNAWVHLKLACDFYDRDTKDERLTKELSDGMVGTPWKPDPLAELCVVQSKVVGATDTLASKVLRSHPGVPHLVWPGPSWTRAQAARVGVHLLAALGLALLTSV